MKSFPVVLHSGLTGRCFAAPVKTVNAVASNALEASLLLLM